MAVVDILISKTFDASVICPAEQTLVVDDAIYDDAVAELERMGARMLEPDEVDALAACAFDADGRPRSRRSGRSCADLAALAGFAVGRRKVLVAPLPADLEALAAHPLVQEKLMPVLGLVRSPSVEHALDACALVTEHGGLGHTSAVYATDEAVIARFAERVQTGRVLVNAPTAVGALGGIYNRMTPTFSLGCGTWGGGNTTDNINYRNLLNVKAVARRQTPPQWFRVPSDTYFNTGAHREPPRPGRRLGGDRHRRGHRAPRRRRGGPAPSACPDVRVFAGVEPEPSEEQVRPASRCSATRRRS